MVRLFAILSVIVLHSLRAECNCSYSKREDAEANEKNHRLISNAQTKSCFLCALRAPFSLFVYLAQSIMNQVNNLLQQQSLSELIKEKFVKCEYRIGSQLH